MYRNQILYIHYHWHDLSTINSSNRVVPLNISLPSDSAMAGLWSDPLVFEGNQNNHEVSHEFKIWPDQTMVCGVSCSWTTKNNLLLTWELSKNIFMKCWFSGEHSLLFGLLVSSSKGMRSLYNTRKYPNFPLDVWITILRSCRGSDSV